MNPYKVLGVRKNASPDHITAAFRRKMKQAHPDRGGSDEEAQQVKQAYDILMDPEARKLFDETGEVHTKYKTTTPSNVQELIRGAFQGVLHTFINQNELIEGQFSLRFLQGVGRDPVNINFIESTKQKVFQSREGIRQDRNKLEAAKKRLKDILGKFSYPDEECFLNLFIQKEILEMDIGIETRIKAIEEHTAALEYLDKCSFQQEQRPTGTVKELRDHQRELLGVTGEDNDITT